MYSSLKLVLMCSYEDNISKLKHKVNAINQSSITTYLSDAIGDLTEGLQIYFVISLQIK